jgi:hypothetical protein
MAIRRGATAKGSASGRGMIAGASDGIPGDSPENALTITALNTAIKDTLEGMLPPVWVSGEVSQFKLHQNGHWYFSLKDAEGSVLDCLVWKNDQARFPMAPEIGMQVFARGVFNIWVKQPRIQFRVTALEDQGSAGKGRTARSVAQTVHSALSAGGRRDHEPDGRGDARHRLRDSAPQSYYRHRDCSRSGAGRLGT